MTDLEQSPELTKKQQYFKEYYKQHSDVVGKYTISKYAKCKYRLTQEQCDLYGPHITTFGKFIKLKEQLQKQFPNETF